jgi:epoxyqueuosine reductase
LDELNKYKELLDIDHIGVADLTPYQEEIRAEFGDAVCGFPRSVSLGITLPHAVLDQLNERGDRPARLNYSLHAYDVINDRLNMAASRLTSELQRSGMLTLPIPAAKSVDSERLYAAVSHKMGAHLAGLGWIGKSCLLITPQFGPRVRWITVLTDAPLAPTGGPQAEKCGGCTKCVDICPAQAYTGRNFQMGEPRHLRFDVDKCKAYLNQMMEEYGTSTCGKCLIICPYGHRTKNTV